MIVGFSGFGFPKAHGAAFGLLAYQSTWLRVHYGPEFLCALLNEQPMGFYASDTLAHEAQRRGIEMLPPDVNESEASARSMRRAAATRLGPRLRAPARRTGRRGRRRSPPATRGRGSASRYVLGARSAEVEALVAARREGGRVPLAGRPGVARAGAGRAALERLAWAGACDSLVGARGLARRRTALWRARRGRARRDGGGRGHAARAAARGARRAPPLEPLAAWDAMVADYATTGLTLGPHPMALLRPTLPRGHGLDRATWRRCRTTRRCASAGWSWRASGRARPRGSCSCCSRTSSGRST